MQVLAPEIQVRIFGKPLPSSGEQSSEIRDFLPDVFCIPFFFSHKCPSGSPAPKIRFVVKKNKQTNKSLHLPLCLLGNKTSFCPPTPVTLV